MKSVTFLTSNSDKYLSAQQVFVARDIELIQDKTDIIEIQSEDAELVARAKARCAYEALKKPVIVSDDSWSFHGLNGFPGVYMHSMNKWLKDEDFLNLTLPLADRRVTLTQYVVFDDGEIQQVFKSETHGTLLKEIRGRGEYPSHGLVALDDDGGLSISEVFATNKDRSGRQASKIWHAAADWISAK